MTRIQGVVSRNWRLGFAEAGLRNCIQELHAQSHVWATCRELFVAVTLDFLRTTKNRFGCGFVVVSEQPEGVRSPNPKASEWAIHKHSCARSARFD